MATPGLILTLVSYLRVIRGVLTGSTLGFVSHLSLTALSVGDFLFLCKLFSKLMKQPCNELIDLIGFIIILLAILALVIFNCANVT